MYSLSRGEDVEALDNVDERDCLVLFPFLHGLLALDQDDKVILSALVVDLGLLGFAFGHGDGVWRVLDECGLEWVVLELDWGCCGCCIWSEVQV